MSASICFALSSLPPSFIPPDLMVLYSFVRVLRIFSASSKCGEDGYFSRNGVRLDFMIVSYSFTSMRSRVGNRGVSFLKAAMEGSVFLISATLDFSTVFSA